MREGTLIPQASGGAPKTFKSRFYSSANLTDQQKSTDQGKQVTMNVFGSKLPFFDAKYRVELVLENRRVEGKGVRTFKGKLEAIVKQLISFLSNHRDVGLGLPEVLAVRLTQIRKALEGEKAPKIEITLPVKIVKD